MKLAYLVLAMLGAGLITGCTNLPRSRDLANPNVSAVTLAQQVCSNCHGITGNSVSPIFPNLAAQPQAYLIGQLKGFKSHGREDPAGFEYMWGVSRSLTDEQITGLASYYANQRLARQPIEGNASDMPAGETIFKSGMAAENVPACFACHGDAGQGNETFPRIAGQHADYIVKQLNVFQRTNERPLGAVMKTVAHELTPEDIKDLAAYLQALPNR
ncbi:MAG TPA: cytochrome c4 [Polaromonas sp.]|uniref:c-type cytochrome n=1 Tax=Polaromonas sp. UBA4122 TaxID=1947074 RepID=UPI000EC84661|nr:c-type cytochrome [Polaromonas sp. UBA4122]HAL38150.1 cytochrome c4 [Polaromonas sp.]